MCYFVLLTDLILRREATANRHRAQDLLLWQMQDHNWARMHDEEGQSFVRQQEEAETREQYVGWSQTRVARR